MFFHGQPDRVQHLTANKYDGTDNDWYDAAFQPIDAKYDVGFKAGQHEFFPYPTSVMDKNPNLVQNPGWDGK